MKILGCFASIDIGANDTLLWPLAHRRLQRERFRISVNADDGRRDVPCGNVVEW